jgi:undecaprenyl diphosphate synthase
LPKGSQHTLGTDKASSLQKVDTKPLHIAIIMDGNGRWAKARHKMRTFGHKAGVEALRRTIAAANDLGVSHMTVFAFSTENWRRPAAEVSDLMGLLKAFIQSDLNRLASEGVCVRIIGQESGLPKDILDCVKEAQDRTQNNSRFYLQVALNYGSQLDIVEAAKAFATKVSSGECKTEDLTIETFGRLLSTHGLPELDLVIRTSGEHRLSNFLLWEAAYAEFVFQDILWPDYDGAALKAALDIYFQRERRFGAIEAGYVTTA